MKDVSGILSILKNENDTGKPYINFLLKNGKTLTYDNGSEFPFPKVMFVTFDCKVVQFIDIDGIEWYVYCEEIVAINLTKEKLGE